MDGRFCARLRRCAWQLNRSWSLPTDTADRANRPSQPTEPTDRTYQPSLPDGPTGRAYRTGCRPRRVQPVFSVYNFMDEIPAECTIWGKDRTLGPFFVREIVHIEVFMSIDGAQRTRGHRPRLDSDVTGKGLRPVLPSAPLAGVGAGRHRAHAPCARPPTRYAPCARPPHFRPPRFRAPPAMRHAPARYGSSKKHAPVSEMCFVR